MIGDDVCNLTLDILNIGNILREINATSITFLHKGKCSKSVKDFRPMSCCNEIYKCISRVLCARLRDISPDIIPQNQGAFIHSRFIAHNIMVCQLAKGYERKNSLACCIIKLDLQKAYDIDQWAFLEEMLVGLEFLEDFVKLIMTCIRTPRFSLAIYGSLHGFFEG